MNTRRFVQWCGERIRNYNLFIPDDEDDYEDDESKDPATIAQQQRYATRIYVPLLISK